MKIPVKNSSSEMTIKGSRFLSESFVLASQSEVREIVKEQKQKYADATHVCHAFFFGKNAEIMGISDDGEPGGTAGRPMLDVLKGRGVTNILVTITRWFGGTLLGTGGLVKAYGDGTKNVIEATEFEELVEKSEFSFECDYQQYQSIKKIFEGYSISEITEDFGESIKITGKIYTSEFEDFKSTVFDKTNGKTKIV